MFSFSSTSHSGLVPRSFAYLLGATAARQKKIVSVEKNTLSETPPMILTLLLPLFHSELSNLLMARIPFAKHFFAATHHMAFRQAQAQSLLLLDSFIATLYIANSIRAYHLNGYFCLL